MVVRLMAGRLALNQATEVRPLHHQQRAQYTRVAVIATCSCAPLDRAAGWSATGFEPLGRHCVLGVRLLRLPLWIADRMVMCQVANLRLRYGAWGFDPLALRLFPTVKSVMHHHRAPITYHKRRVAGARLTRQVLHIIVGGHDVNYFVQVIYIEHMFDPHRSK